MLISEFKDIQINDETVKKKKKKISMKSLQAQVIHIISCVKTYVTNIRDSCGPITVAFIWYYFQVLKTEE